jgi:NAD(P)-dependent dehydrogenase (short-subunit alcohol dehydrogenase family)
MFDLSGKIALVTGGSRGIGRAICISLAEAGAYVIVNYRSNLNAAKETVNKIKDNDGSSEYIQANVSKCEEVEIMFEKIIKKHGRLDILVNNAGILSRFPFLELPVEEWDRLMNTNARGYFLCAQYAARIMVNQKYGRIINVSSISQINAAAGRVHYCAAKGAIGMLTKGMALELTPFGVTVNAIGPGSIHTDFNDDVLSDPGYYQKCKDGIPAGRLGKPEDISGAAVYLASDEASFVSGAMIIIDGAMIVK